MMSPPILLYRPIVVDAVGEKDNGVRDTKSELNKQREDVLNYN